ncbi:MAG: spore coat protein CotJB [Clostridia bacterium]|nr:spore coat protein CotJB [Clostridia bacterium]MBQ7046788.1 spore coat protein CotJB [Oscillospiraceae bacterium]
MTNREILLKKLSAAQFTQWELHLYLDTHPSDLQALALFKKCEAKYRMLREEFEEKYGPLSHLDSVGAEWLKNPWPWDIEGCSC